MAILFISTTAMIVLIIKLTHREFRQITAWDSVHQNHPSGQFYQVFKFLIFHELQRASIIKLLGTEFIISHTLQCERYFSFACPGKLKTYHMGDFAGHCSNCNNQFCVFITSSYLFHLYLAENPSVETETLSLATAVSFFIWSLSSVVALHGWLV